MQNEHAILARLIALSDDVTPTELLLGGDEHTIGRSMLCDVVINRQTVSRLHARIVREGPRYLLHDAGSANGTFVNGQLINGPHILSNHDTIAPGLGGELLRFLDPDPTVVPHTRLRLDERTQAFYLGNALLELTPNQQRLLSRLYRSQGELVSREACAEAIWGRDYDPGLDAEALDRAVSNLRAALRRVGQADELLQTRRGMGYILTVYLPEKS
ncbi:FHA domain-containing protein [Candidatus Chloroploca asiatica]|uniref:FHA domain-containing protein n=1 Tax=Candidatus Chloroploca asiatica TaxID=1506545 RepID=A0A2H3L9M3_9CHLR|nr:FHA domain-containing protein [Candidatus Chloroploca asiatica]PDW00042.1 hypothetical protein A9Q02_22060 [Candidatus Chloroploca asiatica]